MKKITKLIFIELEKFSKKKILIKFPFIPNKRIRINENFKKKHYKQKKAQNPFKKSYLMRIYTIFLFLFRYISHDLI